jgi:uncharacterized integral membrane protein (TIGR00698 family)
MTPASPATAPPAHSSNPYVNPALADYLDSFEGITWPQPVEQPQELAGRCAARRRLHDYFEAMGALAPGVLLAVVLAMLASWAAPRLGKMIVIDVFHQPAGSPSPVSEIMLAIVLGIVIRNTIGLPAIYEDGLRLCLKRVLRFGIALLGLRLSLLGLAKYAAAGTPIVIVCITVALLTVAWIGRAMKLPRRLATLISVGTSICGISAIVAVAPVIDAEEDEVSYAVACITLFGLMTLFVYPFFSHWLFGADPRQVGLFLGTAVHDTSQVTGAGLMYQQIYGDREALNAATTTKLIRNVFMAGVIPLMALLYHRGSDDRKRAAMSWHQAIPFFVVAFVALAAVRSIGDWGGDHPFGFMSKSFWMNWFAGGKTPAGVSIKPIADQTAVWCLTIALAAVGLGTSLKKLRILGFKPLSAGFAAAAIVGGVSIALVKFVSPFLLHS